MNAAPPATGLVPVAGGAFVVSGEGRQGALGGALAEGPLLRGHRAEGLCDRLHGRCPPYTAARPRVGGTFRASSGV